MGGGGAGVAGDDDLQSAGHYGRCQGGAVAAEGRQKHIGGVAGTVVAGHQRLVRRRAELLLKKLADGTLPPEELRAVRAVEVLERIADAEARRVLEDLAGGPPEAPVTREARAALQRLGCN